MISRLNNNNSFRSVDELSSEQESSKTTQAEFAQQVLITEVAFPKFAAADNEVLFIATAMNIKEPASIEFPNLKTEEKKL